MHRDRKRHQHRQDRTDDQRPRPPGPNANGWNKTDVTASPPISQASTATPEDSRTAAATCKQSKPRRVRAPITSPRPPAPTSRATRRGHRRGGVNIDKTAPTASAVRAGRQRQRLEQHRRHGQLHRHGRACRGSTSATPDVVLSSEGAGQSASGTCTDKAENINAPATVSGINIDKTAPTLDVGAADPPITG